MLTSIIIPTYNRAHLLARAVNSVIEQSLKEWQLIIVDDGSTDNTEEVIKPFLKDRRIVYLKKANSGAAASRNEGVYKSSGDLITFLDSDDEAEGQWLERMTEHLTADAPAVVCCGLRRFDAKGVLIDTILPASMEPMFKDVAGRFTNGGVFLMHRKIFLDIGGFDPELRSGQHTELAFRLIPYIKAANIAIKNIMLPLIRVHIHDGERIRFNDNSIYLGAERMLKKHDALFQKHIPQQLVLLAMAGVSGVRSKRYAQAKQHFWKAIRTKPSSVILWSRWIVSQLPFVRDWVWKRKGWN